jgi:hypothetical protein
LSIIADLATTIARLMKLSTRTISIFALCSLAPYLASFSQPVFTCEDGSVFKGLQLFLWGPLGLLQACPAWFANPTLFVAFGLMYSKALKPSVIVAASTLFLALTSFMVRDIYTGPSNSPITRYGPGFYLWLGACAIPLVALGLAYSNRPKESPRVAG